MIETVLIVFAIACACVGLHMTYTFTKRDIAKTGKLQRNIVNTFIFCTLTGWIFIIVKLKEGLKNVCESES